jgi:hypothetical protein
MSVEGKRPLTVFLCHSSSDKSEVRKLYSRLLGDGIAPWLDACPFGSRLDMTIKLANPDSRKDTFTLRRKGGYTL